VCVLLRHIYSTSKGGGKGKREEKEGEEKEGRGGEGKEGRRGGKEREGEGKTLWICSPQKNF